MTYIFTCCVLLLGKEQSARGKLAVILMQRILYRYMCVIPEHNTPIQ